VFLFAGCSDESESPKLPAASQAGALTPDFGQFADQATSSDPERQKRIKENVEFQLREQLQGQPVAVGEIELDYVEGFDSGMIRIGQQAIRFITSKDDKNLFLIGAGPFDASLTAEGRAEAIREGERQAAQAALRRADELRTAIQDLPKKGPEGAAVTLVEFSDFQCPFCKGASETIEQLLEKYSDDIQFSYMHFPLNMHPWALPAAITASCTSTLDHDAFWTLHDAYFENQDDLTLENVIEKSRGFVAGTGIDMAAWSECAEDDASASHAAAVEAVDRAMFLGNAYGLTGTPGFFINGEFLRGSPPFDQFAEIIEDAIAKASE
jgi:protein-disulfide isomerase